MSAPIHREPFDYFEARSCAQSHRERNIIGYHPTFAHTHSLGILCTCIAFWWQTKSDTGGKKFSWYFLWDKFPKFVLGYFLCSTVLSVVLPLVEGTAESDAIQRAVMAMNRWWFGIGFVGIGVGTNLRDLWAGAIGSGVIQGYLVCNILDMGIALGLSYALF